MKRDAQAARPPLPRPSPAATVVEITDPTTAGESIQVIEQDAVQMESNPLRARRVMVRLGRSILIYQSTNLAIRTRTFLRDGLVAYVAFGPRASGTLNGLPLGPERVLASTSGVEAEFVVAAGYESVAFLVPPDDLRAHLHLRQREDPSLIPRGMDFLRMSPGVGPALFEWWRRLAEAAATHPEAFDSVQTNSIAQCDLFEMLLSSIGSAVEAERTPRDGTRRAHHRIVQIAEDYALKHAGEPLYVSQLCRAASVSERTLQNAFRQMMGMTPVAYLTRMRLHRVRHALREAAPHSTTVKAEALKWGFWHLGDFSRAYKECFGELPSDTLRRRESTAAPPLR